MKPLIFLLYPVLQYVINIIYTKVGPAFKAWVGRQVEERNQRMISDNYIEMDPEIEQAFRASSHVSSK